MMKYRVISGLRFLKIIPVALGIMVLMVSCDLFFKKELRQDQQLAYYRHRGYVISDSITSSVKRIKAFKTLVSQAGEDKYLITPRKKNMLLSEIYTSISAEYHDLFRIEEAIESCNLAIMLNVENKYAYFNRGYLHEMTSEDSLAIEDYSRVLAIDEHYVDAYYNRGMIYERNTDYQLAIEDYSRAIKQNPTYLADVYNNRGNTYQEMNFADKAVNDYTMALNLDSTKTMSYYNRANAYMSLNKPNEALLDFQKVLELEPENLLVIDKVKSLETELPQKLQPLHESAGGS